MSPQDASTGNYTLISGKAYRIFLTEFEKHIEHFDRFLAGEIQRSTESLAQASARFHTIKGGSGFFGFDEIAKAAGKLEVLLQRPSSALEKSWEEVEVTYSELKHAAKQLPVPTGE